MSFVAQNLELAGPRILFVYEHIHTRHFVIGTKVAPSLCA